MAVKIRLKRMGKIRAPYYRIVVADSRVKRDGKTIEQIGKYHPKADPSFIYVDSERAQYWLGVGAQPSEPVMAILKKTGDWQKFKGEPAPEPLKVAEPKPDKRARFDAALSEAHKEPEGEAVSAKKKPAKKAAAKKSSEKSSEKPDRKDDEAKADDKAEAPAKADDKAEAPAEAAAEPATEAAAEEPKAESSESES